MSRNIAAADSSGRPLAGDRHEEVEDNDQEHPPTDNEIHPHSHLVHGSPSLASYSFAGNFSADDLQELLGAMAGEHAHANAHDNAHDNAHRTLTLHGNEDHCHGDLHHSDAPAVTDNIDPEAKAQARSDRKRSREKQRRSDINKQFDDLQAVLKVIEAEEKEGYVYASALTASSSSSARATNRVELMARTIHYLEKFRHSQKKLKRDVQMLTEQLMQARKAGEETAAKLKEIVFQQPPAAAPTKQVMMMVPMMMSGDGTASYAPQCAAAAAALGMPFMNSPQGSFFMPQPFINNNNNINNNNQQQQQQQQASATPASQPNANTGTPAPAPSTNNGAPVAENNSHNHNTTHSPTAAPSPAPVPIMPHPNSAMMVPMMQQYPMMNMNTNMNANANAHHSTGQQQQQPSYFMAPPHPTTHMVTATIPANQLDQQHHANHGQPQYIFAGMGQPGMPMTGIMPEAVNMGTMTNHGTTVSGSSDAAHPHSANGMEGNNSSPPPPNSTPPTHEDVVATTDSSSDHHSKTGGNNGSSNLAHCA